MSTKKPARRVSQGTNNMGEVQRIPTGCTDPEALDNTVGAARQPVPGEYGPEQEVAERERFIRDSGGAAGGTWGSDAEYEAELQTAYADELREAARALLGELKGHFPDIWQEPSSRDVYVLARRVRDLVGPSPAGDVGTPATEGEPDALRRAASALDHYASTRRTSKARQRWRKMAGQLRLLASAGEPTHRGEKHGPEAPGRYHLP